MDITFIIIGITIIVSFLAFEKPSIFDKLLLSPYMIVQRKEWYRLVTHGFIHANWEHLLINMLVFYSFGQALSFYLNYYVGNSSFHFVMIYFGGMIVATISTVFKNKNNLSYRGLGASGAVSAIMFACIFFNPWNKLYFFGLFPIPGIVFGVLYLAYCSYMSKKSGENINHDAHFWGAVFGFVYPIIIEPRLLSVFMKLLLNPIG